jgi:hypothetical protein
LFWVDTTLTQYVVDSKGFLAGSQLTCEDANKINMRNMMPVPTLRAFDSNMFSDLVRNKRRILDRIRWQFKRFPIAPVSDSVSIMEDLMLSLEVHDPVYTLEGRASNTELYT